jgi:hypothetical protein
VERLGGVGKALISLVWDRNVSQHENGQKNEADTARNPYFTGSPTPLDMIRTKETLT